MEVGLYFGGSALAFAAAHKDPGNGPCGQHVAIDPVQSTVWENAGRLHLQRAKLAGYVDVREAASAEVLPSLVAELCRRVASV